MGTFTTDRRLKLALTPCTYVRLRPTVRPRPGPVNNSYFLLALTQGKVRIRKVVNRTLCVKDERCVIKDNTHFKVTGILLHLSVHSDADVFRRSRSGSHPPCCCYSQFPGNPGPLMDRSTRTNWHIICNCLQSALYRLKKIHRFVSSNKY